MIENSPFTAVGLSRRSSLRMLASAPFALGALAAPPRPALPQSQPIEMMDRTLPRGVLPGGTYDQLIAAQASRDQFSGTVVLVHRGKPILARSYGMANKQLAIPNRIDTIFSLASMSKMFAGIAIAQLAARGAVDLYSTLGSYLSGFDPDVADAVTVQQLYTHTSGLSDYQANSVWQAQRGTWTSVAQEFAATLSIIQQSPLLFAPGMRYSYSNSGYYTLGAIVQQVAGLTYRDYVRQHIFSPAGMIHTDWFGPSDILTDENIAHAYGPAQQGGQRIDLTAQAGARGRLADFGGGSGGGYSSAQDLLRLAAALREGRLVPPAYADFISTGHYAVEPALQKADQPAAQTFFSGCGFEARIVNGQRVFGHGGAAPVPGGIATNLSIYPDQDWVAVILANYYFNIVPILELQDELITSQPTRRRRVGVAAAEVNPLCAGDQA